MPSSARRCPSSATTRSSIARSEGMKVDRLAEDGLGAEPGRRVQVGSDRSPRCRGCPCDTPTPADAPDLTDGRRLDLVH